MRFDHDTYEPVRVLAIDPGGPRLGFAVLEGEAGLLDWGIRRFPTGHVARAIKRIVEIVDRYEPDVLIVEDVSAKHAGRSPNVRRLVKALQTLGRRRGLPTYSYSRSRVRAVFLQANAFSKQEIAKVVALRFPVLTDRLPPDRKPWQSEHVRTLVFEAIALALTFFDHREKARQAA